MAAAVKLICLVLLIIGILLDYMPIDPKVTVFEQIFAVIEFAFFIKILYHFRYNFFLV